MTKHRRTPVQKQLLATIAKQGVLCWDGEGAYRSAAGEIVNRRTLKALLKHRHLHDGDDMLFVGPQTINLAKVVK